MKLIVKVDVARVQDPAAHVRRLLRDAGASGRVEEVFPDLRSGSSAGWLSVTLAGKGDSRSRESTVDALRAGAAVLYVEPAPPRRAKS